MSWNIIMDLLKKKKRIDGMWNLRFSKSSYNGKVYL